MARKATAWCLALMTLVAPILCCCSAAGAMSWVLVRLGCQPITCQLSECCHETVAAHEHSHAAKHHHHGHGHSHPDADRLAHNKTPASEKSQGAPKQCPCRQDGNQITGLPISENVATQSIASSLHNSVWALLTLESTATSLATIEPDSVASLFCPANGCLNGQEILRAYCVLRI